MADEFCDASNIVTAFFLNTCRLKPGLSQRDYVQATACCAALVTARGHTWHDNEEAEFIPLTTGSVAEFYIEPMLPHVGDIDVMCHLNTELAIPRGYPPLAQLPAEFHNYVTVHEIIDSQLPGYVNLELCYLLTQCSDDGKYKAVKYEERPYTKNDVIPIYAYKGLRPEGGLIIIINTQIKVYKCKYIHSSIHSVKLPLTDRKRILSHKL